MLQRVEVAISESGSGSRYALVPQPFQFQLAVSNLIIKHNLLDTFIVSAGVCGLVHQYAYGGCIDFWIRPVIFYMSRGIDDDVLCFEAVWLEWFSATWMFSTRCFVVVRSMAFAFHGRFCTGFPNFADHFLPSLLRDLESQYHFIVRCLQH